MRLSDIFAIALFIVFALGLIGFAIFAGSKAINTIKEKNYLETIFLIFISTSFGLVGLIILSALYEVVVQ